MSWQEYVLRPRCGWIGAILSHQLGKKKKKRIRCILINGYLLGGGGEWDTRYVTSRNYWNMWKSAMPGGGECSDGIIVRLSAP